MRPTVALTRVIVEAAMFLLLAGVSAANAFVALSVKLPKKNVFETNKNRKIVAIANVLAKCLLTIVCTEN